MSDCRIFVAVNGLKIVMIETCRAGFILSDESYYQQRLHNPKLSDKQRKSAFPNIYNA